MKKILLIEDDLITIGIYENLLKEAGFEVETLMSGEEGLARMKEIKEGRGEKPDLVLLDLILPDINGMEVLEKTKKEKETKDIPFLILTNYFSNGIEEKGKELGAKEYINKTNINPSEIVEVIKRYIKNDKQ